MDWLINLFTQQNSVAHIVLLFSIVIAVRCHLHSDKRAATY